MKARVDSAGRIVVPKALRAALGLTTGSTVEISRYGEGLTLIPGGRTARLVRADDGSLVAEAETVVTDEVVFDLIESGRR